MKVIVTGFEPFNNRSINASYETISRLDGVEKILLPVKYNHVLKPIEEIYDKKPDILVHVGEAASYDNITIELEAHNIANGKDNEGIIKEDEPIIIDGESTLKTKVDISNINDVNISTNAGKYLCNYTYYLSLNKFKDENTKVLFIHLPLIKEQGGKYELSYLVNKMNEIIKILKESQ